MPDLAFYKFLYQSVGEEWAWRDRLQMSNVELRQILTSSRTQVHVMYVSGLPGGYVELYRHDDDSVEIVYFGLRRDYMGRGLGKHLLSYGIARAWEMGRGTCLAAYLQLGWTARLDKLPETRFPRVQGRRGADAAALLLVAPFGDQVHAPRIASSSLPLRHLTIHTRSAKPE